VRERRTRHVAGAELDTKVPRVVPQADRKVRGGASRPVGAGRPAGPRPSTARRAARSVVNRVGGNVTFGRCRPPQVARRSVAVGNRVRDFTGDVEPQVRAVRRTHPTNGRPAMNETQTEPLHTRGAPPRVAERFFVRILTGCVSARRAPESVSGARPLTTLHARAWWLPSIWRSRPHGVPGAALGGTGACAVSSAPGMPCGSPWGGRGDATLCPPATVLVTGRPGDLMGRQGRGSGSMSSGDRD
jgi:hypothetical protein